MAHHHTHTHTHPKTGAWPGLGGLCDGVQYKGRGVGAWACLLQPCREESDNLREEEGEAVIGKVKWQGETLYTKINYYTVIERLH